MRFPFKKVIFLFLAICSFGFTQAPTFYYLKTPDGHTLRIAHWLNQKPQKASKTIVFLEGRGSFIEKHRETVKDLLKQGHDIWIFDWRGHGGSSRLLNNPQKVHIDDYQTYLNDMHQIMQEIIKEKTRFPITLLGVSFGGHIALRYAAHYGRDLESIILVSPMLDILTSPFPYHIARALSSTAFLLGFGEYYAIGYGDYNPQKSSFDKNTNTQDYQRYEYQRRLSMNNMHFVTGGPTYGWVKATFKSIDYIKTPGFLAQIKIPTLIISAGLDKVVDSIQDQHFCSKIPTCQHKIYPKAFHNIPNEINEIRNQLLNDIDLFLKNKTTQKLNSFAMLETSKSPRVQ